METTKALAELIRDYGETFYGSESPEYIAQQWTTALPEAGLTTLREWLDEGFWVPEVARELTDNGIFPWEVPADIIYDLCNADLSVSEFIREN